MIRDKRVKRLKLSHETIRTMNEQQLRAVCAGGEIPTVTWGANCPNPALN